MNHRLRLLGLALLLAAPAVAQQITPAQQAQLDQRYRRQNTNIPPESIVNTALTEAVSFGGIVVGPYNALAPTPNWIRYNTTLGGLERLDASSVWQPIVVGAGVTNVQTTGEIGASILLSTLYITNKVSSTWVTNYVPGPDIGIGTNGRTLYITNTMAQTWFTNFVPVGALAFGTNGRTIYMTNTFVEIDPVWTNFAWSDNHFLIGRYAAAAVGASEALVFGAFSTGGTKSVVIGSKSRTSEGGVSVGWGSTAVYYSVASGAMSEAGPNGAFSRFGISIGPLAAAGNGGVAIGGFAKTVDEGVAIGGSSTSILAGVAIGDVSYARVSAISIGNAASGSTYSIAIGANASAEGVGNIAIGSDDTAGISARTVIPSWFTNTANIGGGTAVSNGWFHYRGFPVIAPDGTIRELDSTAFMWITNNGVSRRSNNIYTATTTQTMPHVIINGYLQNNHAYNTYISNGVVVLGSTTFTVTAPTAGSTEFSGNGVLGSYNTSIGTAANFGGNWALGCRSSSISGSSYRNVHIASTSPNSVQTGVNSPDCAIIASQSGTLNYYNTASALIGGFNNTLTATYYSSILGGARNTINSGVYGNVLLGGWGLSMTNPVFSAIIAGSTNAMYTATGSIIAGGSYTRVTNCVNTFAAGSGITQQNVTVGAAFGSVIQQNHSATFVANFAGTHVQTVSNNTIILNSARGVAVNTNNPMGIALYVNGEASASTSTVVVTLTNTMNTIYTNQTPFRLTVVASLCISNDGVTRASAAFDVGGVRHSEVAETGSGTNTFTLTGFVSAGQTWSVTNTGSGGSMGLSRLTQRRD